MASMTKTTEGTFRCRIKVRDRVVASKTFDMQARVADARDYVRGAVR